MAVPPGKVAVDSLLLLIMGSVVGIVEGEFLEFR
jgi:hypothetical protein